MLLEEDGGRLRALPPRNDPWLSVIMLPVEFTYFAWFPYTFDLSNGLQTGVDFELSFRAVFGSFLFSIPMLGLLIFAACRRPDPKVLLPFLL